MKQESYGDDAKRMEHVLKLLVETRERLTKELASRTNDITRGSERGLSWVDLERELSDASWF